MARDVYYVTNDNTVQVIAGPYLVRGAAIKMAETFREWALEHGTAPHYAVIHATEIYTTRPKVEPQFKIGGGGGT